MSQADEISIQFPARRGFLYLTRLNASAGGTEAGLDIDELDDLRLAVNELINWLLMDAEGDGQVNLSFFALDGTIEIIGTRSCEAELPDREMDDLASAVLGATVDEYQVLDEPGQRGLKLRKSSTR